MTLPRNSKSVLAVTLVFILIAGIVIVARSAGTLGKTHVVAYFDNSNGIFTGDDVRILGVPVGRIDKIEPQPQRVKVSFWFNDKYTVPADARAVILSPSLVTARAIQLTPTYSSGAQMRDDAVIPQDHTAVPVEYDDFRQQLQKLTATLQPTEPGGVSTLGSLVDTTADNLRGQGASIRDTVIKLSKVFSALGDHSKDIFSTVKSLSELASTLQSSTDLMRQLNQNLAAATGLVANDPNEVANAVNDLNTAVDDVQGFVAENREALGTTSDQLASISTALNDSLDDIEQALHVTPGTLSNFVNTYQPAQGVLSGALAVNNLANPITFLCGAVQAASRLNAEQSAKLCVQYLAPIIKNRQYNFPPLGINPFVGTQARPNEVTYSEDWMRPDYTSAQPQAAPGAPPLAAEAAPTADNPQPATATTTDPAAGLPGLMVPPPAEGS
jgi:phospholipid/cholesterol/gamma-HCH transport system substrate-binding protein